MGVFVFRLQKVLDHRLRVEEEKKQAFVRARNAYLKEKEILDNLKEKLNICLSRNVPQYTGAFSYIIKQNYISLLVERIEDQSKKVDIYEQEMEKKKAEFMESKMDRKVIEKLKENAYNDFKITENMVEQKQNDEFALYGYMRK